MKILSEEDEKYQLLLKEYESKLIPYQNLQRKLKEKEEEERKRKLEEYMLNQARAKLNEEERLENEKRNRFLLMQSVEYERMRSQFNTNENIKKNNYVSQSTKNIKNTNDNNNNYKNINKRNPNLNIKLNQHLNNNNSNLIGRNNSNLYQGNNSSYLSNKMIISSIGNSSTEINSKKVSGNTSRSNPKVNVDNEKKNQILKINIMIII